MVATAAGVATLRYLGSKLSWLSGRLLNGRALVQLQPIPLLATDLPPFQGWDTRLRSSLAEVRVLTVAPRGPASLRYLNKWNTRNDKDLSAFYVDVWDDFGFQIRGAAFNSLSTCQVRVATRAAGRAQPSARQLFLGVAQ